MLGDSRRGRTDEMLHAFFVDQLIPPNHILRLLDKVLDTQWVRAEVASSYSATKGRRSWDPEVVVRMMLLGYLYGYSEKRLCEEVAMHMGFRWFCRLQPSDPVPDRTTLVKLRNERWQQELWVTILEKSIEACIKAGLVSGRHVAIDGTIIQANAAIASIEPIEPPLSLRDHLRARCGWVKLVPPEEKPAPEKPRDKDDDLRPGGSADFKGQSRSNATHCSTTDPDAFLYRKGPCTGAQLAYLGHACIDTRSRVVLAVTVTQARTSGEWDAGAVLLDEANARVEGRVKVVSADAGYGVERFLAEVEARGLEAHIPIRGKQDQRPEPVAPRRTVVKLDDARRARLKRLGVRGRNRAIRASQTRGYRISRKLRLRIEHLFGEAKTCHGLRRARYRGMEKVKQQMILTAVVINLKRLAASLGRRRPAAHAVATTVGRAFSTQLSALNSPHTRFTELWAALTAVLTPVLLAARGAAAHA